ncbi:MAG: hypothetical protein H6807_06735 [Planctomycetes bacterium]|nr:hypothetical protein [Planctomycetota bacterium]
MTAKNSPDVESLGTDQEPYEFQYDHGRMPFFMKLVWIFFLALSCWYIVSFLLPAVGVELGG